MKQTRLLFGGKQSEASIETTVEKRDSQSTIEEVKEVLPVVGDRQSVGTDGFNFTPKQIQRYEQSTKPRLLSSLSYDPILDAPFYYGESVPFSFLAQAFSMVS